MDGKKKRVGIVLHIVFTIHTDILLLNACGTVAHREHGIIIIFTETKKSYYILSLKVFSFFFFPFFLLFLLVSIFQFLSMGWRGFSIF